MVERDADFAGPALFAQAPNPEAPAINLLAEMTALQAKRNDIDLKLASAKMALEKQMKQQYPQLDKASTSPTPGPPSPRAPSEVYSVGSSAQRLVRLPEPGL
jgi:hypothetical protein